VQAERRLERSRNATTAAVLLTEARCYCVLFFPSATSAREAAAERALVADSSKSRHLKIIQNKQKENSFCAIIAQTPPFFLSDSPDESVVVFFDCAQDGAIRSNKSAIMLSDTWGFSAGKYLPVDTVAHGNKLQATADAP
jgi:hypothetical protein